MEKVGGNVSEQTQVSGEGFLNVMVVKRIFLFAPCLFGLGFFGCKERHLTCC